MINKYFNKKQYTKLWAASKTCVFNLEVLDMDSSVDFFKVATPILLKQLLEDYFNLLLDLDFIDFQFPEYIQPDYDYYVLRDAVIKFGKSQSSINDQFHYCSIVSPYLVSRLLLKYYYLYHKIELVKENQLVMIN